MEEVRARTTGCDLGRELSTVGLLHDRVCTNFYNVGESHCQAEGQDESKKPAVSIPEGSLHDRTSHARMSWYARNWTEAHATRMMTTAGNAPHKTASNHSYEAGVTNHPGPTRRTQNTHRDLFLNGVRVSKGGIRHRK